MIFPPTRAAQNNPMADYDEPKVAAKEIGEQNGTTTPLRATVCPAFSQYKIKRRRLTMISY